MPTILVHGEPLNRVSNFKYIGCILTDDFCDGSDMERAMSVFKIVLEFYSENYTRLMLNPFSIYFSLFVHLFIVPIFG